jgi:hypothetical protein
MNKWTSIVTALALCAGMSTVVAAQEWRQYRDPDPYGYYDRDRNADRAERFGYHDGVIDGRNDAATGHSFRPTYDHSYRNATNGYIGPYGDWGEYLQAYREMYRQAYTQGYEAGFREYRGWHWGR